EAVARRERVQTRIQEGARPDADLSAVQYEEASAQLEATNARGNAASARLRLEYAVGAELPPKAVPDIDTLSPPEATPPARSDPALTALELRRKAALASATLQKRNRLPLLSGAAETGVRGQKDHVFPAYRVAVSLSVPIWDQGFSTANAKAAEAEASELS